MDYSEGGHGWRVIQELFELNVFHFTFPKCKSCCVHQEKQTIVYETLQHWSVDAVFVGKKLACDRSPAYQQGEYLTQEKCFHNMPANGKGEWLRKALFIYLQNRAIHNT